MRKVLLSFFKSGALREQKLLSWCSWGLLIFVSGFLWAPSRDGLEAIYALSLFIPMLLLLFKQRPSWREYGGWFTVLALAYAGYAAITSAWSVSHDMGFFALQFVILATWLCGSSWLAYHDRLDLALIMRLLIRVGAAASVINLLWFYSQHSFVDRLESLTINHNPNAIGSVFGIVTLLAYIEWLQARSVAKSWQAFGLMLLVVMSVLAAQSRANFFALLILVPFACYWAKPNAAKLWLHGLFALLAIGAFLLFSHAIEGIILERGISLRDGIWQAVFAHIMNGSLFFGTGLEKEGRIVIDQLGTYNHAHNAWLDTWYRTGLVGLGLSLVYLGYVYKHMFKRAELFPLYLWLSFGCIYCFFDSRGFFWQIDAKWFCFWVPAGLLAALLNSAQVKSAKLSATR
jgi:hypothetical protein